MCRKNTGGTSEYLPVEHMNKPYFSVFYIRNRYGIMAVQVKDLWRIINGTYTNALIFHHKYVK